MGNSNPPAQGPLSKEMKMIIWENMEAYCVELKPTAPRRTIKEIVEAYCRELKGHDYHLMRRRPQGKKDAMDSQSRRVEGATTSQSSIYRALELQSYALNGPEHKHSQPHFW